MGIGKFLASAGGGSIIGGALSAAGSIFGANASADATEEAVKRQIDWERERATHAHQWEVQDLKAAGLNPILSAGGTGATTGGISAPIPDTSGYAEAGNKFFSALQSQSQTELNKANTAKTGAEVSNINADTANKLEQKALIQAQTAVEQAKKGLITQQELKTKFDAIIREYQTKYKEIAFWNDQIHTAAQSLDSIGKIGFGIYDRLPLGRAMKFLGKAFEKKFGKETGQYFSMPKI